MSPILFNIYMIDLEEEMEKGQAGGIIIGKEKFWSIIYANDVVLLATREEELKEMLRRFKKFLERKGLSLSAEKSKIMMFEIGKREKGRLAMGKRRNRGSQGNKIPRIHTTEEWRSREAYKREIEKSHDCNEEYMEHRRKIIRKIIKIIL